MRVRLPSLTSGLGEGARRAEGSVKMSGERMGDEFSVFTFPFSDCHTPSGALLLVPLTQRDKVDGHVKLETLKHESRLTPTFLL